MAKFKLGDRVKFHLTDEKSYEVLGIVHVYRNSRITDTNCLLEIEGSVIYDERMKNAWQLLESNIDYSKLEFGKCYQWFDENSFYLHASVSEISEIVKKIRKEIHEV